MLYETKRTYSADVPVDDIIADLLRDRDITDVQLFMDPPHPADIPFDTFFSTSQKTAKGYKKDRQKALSALKDIRDSGGMVVVYTDYDADGVSGGAIMWETLHKLGFNVMPYVPMRSEGYGFSKAGIDHVIQKYNPALIISVDHGIVAHDEIAYSYGKGVPVIVTDHHHKQKNNPESALGVFHTDKLSGSGVAYFFAKELVNEYEDAPGANELKKHIRDDYTALAAIGSIADLVPLTETNRSVAKHGLEAMSRTTREGLRSLLKESGVLGQPLTSYHVGYIIAPRINAFGRLEHALDALRLMCTGSAGYADRLARSAGRINRQRQDIVERALEEAETMVDHQQRVVILQSGSWEEGIIGLIAGKMLQKYHKPAIVMTVNDDFAKASVRSVEAVHITNFLKDLEDYLVDMGGHAAAAGFTIKTDIIPDFTEAVYKKAESDISDEDLTRKKVIDVSLPLSSVSDGLVQSIDALEPFGQGNKKPLFMSQAVVEKVQPVGKSGKHVRLVLKDAVGAGIREGIFFNAPENIDSQLGRPFDVMYELQMNFWNGRSRPEMYIKGLQTPEAL